jgi:hypothetical protein
MTISSIQKRKFLDNIYRLMYSTGISETDTVVRQPDEIEVKKEFDAYFSSNRLGLPLTNDVNLLRNSVYTNADLMNLFMARSLLNMEVLYDSVHENNEDLMNVTTILSKRLESLRNRRVGLEKKVDDILFSNSNTDGYFYSFGESFSNLQNIDLNLTTCFVDVENRKAVLPTLKSSTLDFRAPGRINLSNIKYDIIFNGATVISGQPLPSSNNIFDGLNDTSSVASYSSSSLGVCAMVLTIPLNTPFIISKIDGKLNTSSSIVTTAEIIDEANPTNAQYRRKQSNSSYDRFSFDFNPQSSGLIRITFIKYQPDTTNLGKAGDRYTFRFEIKDLIVGGQYYDKEGTLVSSPISIDAGNENKIIDAISIDASNLNPISGDINFFVAQDIDGAVNISDFDWLPISSTSNSNSGFDKIISFNGSTKNIKSIKSQTEEDGISILPLLPTGPLNEINPSTSIYSGISVYRVGVIDENDSPYNPYILDSINQISFKYVSYTDGLYKDLSSWSSVINGTNSTLQLIEMSNKEITNVPSIAFSGNLSTGVSAFLETNLLCEEILEVNHSISKAGDAIDWDLAVYLNGVKIADLQAGEVTKNITWNFIKGINKVVITFDAEGSSSGSISLMDGVSMSNYGTPFLKYYTYVDPFDFKTNRTSTDAVFTIDKYLGRKEILCRKEIKDNSRLVYYSNNINQVEKIRFRADFTRYNNPFGTPSLGEYRIKFKNSINELG